MLNIPTHAPAPDRTDLRDYVFFRLHPERRYRVRAPFEGEIAQAKLISRLPPLKDGQVYCTIVARTGGPILTWIAAVRLDEPGVFPNSDEDIDRAFRRPKAPKGVPA